MITAESNVFKRYDGSLEFRIQMRPLSDSCHTVHLVLTCSAATQYSPRGSYTAVRAWFCGQPSTPSAGIRRCTRHWFSQFVCYAADTQPVAIANTCGQLAELLQVPAVFLVDAATGKPLNLSGPVDSVPAPVPAKTRAPSAAMKALQAAEGGSSQQQNESAVTDMDFEAMRSAGQYTDNTVTLEVPEPQGNWSNVACAGLFTVLDVDNASSFQTGYRYGIMQNCRCGNEAGNRLFCGKHRKAAHIYLLAKNGDLLWHGNSLEELAPALGVEAVKVQTNLDDLGAKLATDSAAAEAPAAASAGINGGSHVAGGEPQAAPVPMPTVPPVLRMHLTPEQIAAAAQQLQNGGAQQDPEAARLRQLQQGWIDVQLQVAAGVCCQSPCMGLNLKLGVSNLQELAAHSGPVPVLVGRRCGYEGGAKRCCKQHRSTFIVLADQHGGNLPGAANLDGLASILKVSSVAMLSSTDLQPLEEYKQMPPSIRWQTSPDRSVLKVWLPPERKQKSMEQQQGADAAGGRQAGLQCTGLDFTVALQQGQAHAMGAILPVLSVTRCCNPRKAPSSCCKIHQPGLMRLIQQGSTGAAQMAFQVCKSLGELAIWLGVQQVEILDSATGQPVDFYRSLVPAAVQLSMPGHDQQQHHSGSSLAGPSLMVQPPQGWAAPAAAAAPSAAPPAAASRMDVDQSQFGAQAVALAAEQQQGNCIVDEIPATAVDNGTNGGGSSRVRGHVIKVPGRPVGAAKNNPCRALNVTVSLTDGQAVWMPGRSQYRIVSVDRCGNEAGNKSRCKPHNDAAVQLLLSMPAASLQPQAAAAAVMGSAEPQQQQLVTTVVAKLNNNAALALHLGVQQIVLRCKETDQDLADISTWSLSTAAGTAARVKPAAAAADERATGSVAEAVTVALPEALQMTLGNVVIPPSMLQQQLGNDLNAAAQAAAAAAAAVSSAAGSDMPALYQLGLVTVGDPKGTSTVSAGHTAASRGLVVTSGGLSTSSTHISLQSSGLAGSIAAGIVSPMDVAGQEGLDATLPIGFKTSAPLAKLANAFKVTQ